MSFDKSKPMAGMHLTIEQVENIAASSGVGLDDSGLGSHILKGDYNNFMNAVRRICQYEAASIRTKEDEV